METVNIKINNVPYTVKAGSTILEACHEVGIDIPTLCYLKEINEIGACRICVVEVKGAKDVYKRQAWRGAGRCGCTRRSRCSAQG